MSESIDVIFSDEIKDKLKGFLGFDVKAEFIYVPKIFRENNIPKEYWQTWKLKSKDGMQVAIDEDNAGYVSVNQKSNDDIKFHAQSGTKRINTLTDGVIEVHNWIQEDGSVINYDKKTRILITKNMDGHESTKNCDVKDIIKKMPVDLQIELTNAINDRETLTTEELQGLKY